MDEASSAEEMSFAEDGIQSNFTDEKYFSSYEDLEVSNNPQKIQYEHFWFCNFKMIVKFFCVF